MVIMAPDSLPPSYPAKMLDVWSSESIPWVSWANSLDLVWRQNTQSPQSTQKTPCPRHLPNFWLFSPLLELWRHNWVSEVPKWTLSVRWRENEPDLCLFFIISVFAILKIPLLFVYHTLLSDPFLLFLEFQTH